MHAAHHPRRLRPYAALLRLGFRLLYNELAGAYDLVANVTSLGQWWEWQRQALPFLPENGLVLEIAHGTGHMLVDLVSSGRAPLGLDLSPAMGRLARQTMRRRQKQAPLVRGRVQALPFASGSLPALVSTFPTEFITEPAALSEFRRVLQPAGRLVIVPSATLRPINALHRLMHWLFYITGQVGSRELQREHPELTWPPNLEQLMAQHGLNARIETVELPRSVVFVVIASKDSNG